MNKHPHPNPHPYPPQGGGRHSPPWGGNTTPLVLKILEDMKATEITVLDVHRLTSITNEMLIATGNSSRQIKAMAENIVKITKEHHLAPIGIEGMDAGEWILIDFGELVVHLMLAETRAFYNLEKLWAYLPPTNNE